MGWVGGFLAPHLLNGSGKGTVFSRAVKIENTLGFTP
jgi:hypothetical protein